MNVSEYSIVYGDRRDVLIVNVGMALADGWQPFGSPGYNSDSQTYFQAVVKYKKAPVEDALYLHDPNPYRPPQPTGGPR